MKSRQQIILILNTRKSFKFFFCILGAALNFEEFEQTD